MPYVYDYYSDYEEGDNLGGYCCKVPVIKVFSKYSQKLFTRFSNKEK